MSTTKHNLSVSGPGTVKAVGETQICIFCHTPHRAQPDTPLWNHLPSATTHYTNYWSETMKAYDSKTKAPPIDGFSKMCLGCHDGTVAMGAVRSRKSEIKMRADMKSTASMKAKGIVGTDLSGGHPLSFVFDEHLRTRRNADPSLMDLKWPITDSHVRLDRESKFQCTSCHNPHENKSTGGWPPLWHKKTYDEVCVACHESSASPLSLRSKSVSTKDSPHGDSKKVPRGCGSCHKGHGKFDTPMLPEQKDRFCFRCHGNDADAEATRKSGDLARDTKAANLKKEFEKQYRHPVEKTGIHRHGESLPEREPTRQRHAECGDCHHSHLVTSTNTMAAVEGVSKQKAAVPNVSFEYEICFKCHSNSANLPPDQTDKLEQFKPSNQSYHPVVAAGRNVNVPSLISPLTVSSLIKCTDCHNNDDPTGPRGPHGSRFKHILVRNFSDIDASGGNYDLCYGCHKQSSILGNQSFTYHSSHISRTTCKTCHNSHGSARYPHLIDIHNNPAAIRPSSSGRLEYIAIGMRSGQCYLTCHGKDHNPGSYPFTVSQDKKDPKKPDPPLKPALKRTK